MKTIKDLKYWKNRGGQIEWRLAALKAEVLEMEKDLAECDRNIKKLEEPDSYFLPVVSE